MVVLAPKRGPKLRRTPRMPGSQDDQAKREKPLAKPEKPAASRPLALVALAKPSADKEKSVAEPQAKETDQRAAPPKDNPIRRESIPGVKLKLGDLKLRKDQPEPLAEPAPDGRETAVMAVELPNGPERLLSHPDRHPDAQFEAEPEIGEAGMPASSSGTASDRVEASKPAYDGGPDHAKPSADQRALIPMPSSLIKPRPVLRSRFFPVPSKPVDAVEEPGDPPAEKRLKPVTPNSEESFPKAPNPVDPAPLHPSSTVTISPDSAAADPIEVDALVKPEEDLDGADPFEEREPDPLIDDRDRPVPGRGEPAPAKRERRKRFKHRLHVAQGAPAFHQEFQQYADQVKGAVSPRFRRLEDFLTDLSPSGVAIAGLAAISTVLLIAATSLNPPVPPINRSLTLSIPDRTVPGESASGAARGEPVEAETPSDPLAGIVSYVDERLVVPEVPAATSQVLATLGTLEGVGQFARAVELAGLQRLLPPGQDFTIFAPNDAAFAELAPTEVESLLQPEGRERLLALVSHHVVPGRLTFDDIAGNSRAYTSLSGQPVPIDAAEFIRIGEASLIDADLLAEGGVIHVIDTLLVPPTP